MRVNALTRTPRTRGRRLPIALAAVFATLLAGLVTVAAPTAVQAAPQPLTGLFQLTAGQQLGSQPPTGTYFRMLQPGGESYLSNGDSRADDKTYTVLSPGTDGGLRTGVYQATPSPAFAANGDALSGKVTAPETFFGIKFATATNKVDPQTGKTTTPPTISADGTTLSGDLRAFAASWNNSHFNQGGPKPDGTLPGLTQPVSGTYDPATKAFHLTWRSLIVGGPFGGFTGEWHLVGTFVPNVSVTTSALADGVIGQAYSAALAATGGKTSYAWTVASGSLPAGLKISSGKITGTPTAPGTSTFTVQVADATTPKNYAYRQLSITIPPIAVNATALPTGLAGKAYPSTKFTSAGGKSTLVWTVTSGALPAGLKLSTAGALSGTPVGPGTSTFTVQVADGSVPKNIASRQFTLTVDPVTVNAAVLPTGLIGKAYPSTKLTASGGKATLVWTVASGTLPAGLKLSTSGALSGTPTTAGTSTFTVQVADASKPKNVATRELSLTVAPFTVATAALSPGKVATTYAAKLTANGGKGTLVWAVPTGSLPPGLKLSTSGSFSGKPTVAGSYTFTVQVADGSTPKNLATRTFTLVVSS